MAKIREIVVVSGKGGTGKTSITAAFAAIAKDTLICDLDVDVPDLYILLQPTVQKTSPFMGGNKAQIVQDTCQHCGNCASLCRFDAIRLKNGIYEVDETACEGCGVCYTLCPAKAIHFPPCQCGQIFESETRFGPMVHAELVPGQENSGKLVSVLKSKARSLAQEKSLSTILCDGSPGIGCPVVSSLSGASLVLAVIEPTVSGWHDFERVAGVCDHFHIPCCVLINRYDLNPAGTAQIEEKLETSHYTYVGRLPFSEELIRATNRGICITEEKSTLSDQIRDIWAQLQVFTPKNARGVLRHLA